jgi:hypothetical protein
MKMISMVGGLKALRKQNIKIGIAFIGLTIATPALATTDGNLTILAVGSQGGVGGYIQVSPNTSGNCPGQIIYIDTSTEVGRGIFAIALTARASGRPIARVDYTGGGSAVCNASLIQL